MNDARLPEAGVDDCQAGMYNWVFQAGDREYHSRKESDQLITSLGQHNYLIMERCAMRTFENLVIRERVEAQFAQLTELGSQHRNFLHGLCRPWAIQDLKVVVDFIGDSHLIDAAVFDGRQEYSSIVSVNLFSDNREPVQEAENVTYM